MKKSFQFIVAVKAVASLAFTAQVMLATVVSMFFGRESIPVSALWQMLFLALFYSCSQFFIFSENLPFQIKTYGRIALLGLSMFTVLTIFAIVFKWFPVQNLQNWLIFIGLYAAVFLIALSALLTVFRVSGIKYNQMLAAYKQYHDVK